ncbi:type VI secretion system baseplate subunit TssK [Geobacter sulfurreducens]|uniref:type VI secretion system baseplate subunit TssK n=1 Tax=Geobacter sulfurreducens TaxID=35554 RepID=UPI0005D87CA9|nr:type VI secretion system baseplate subunit TssK [Geobacter sulfurreducens]AJY70153.1 type VI secretion protein [Geobacter sulfurreducens]QVW35686.1 type VI secretion system baseplate subunit TssK [Geobacter sulfurreducens]UTG93126.1 type VI secretion system baseplate subunit TssK [Geobacter sulfurreducens]
MNAHPPLYWHQGLFLQPHHFQLQDLSVQGRLAPLFRHLHPHFWGAGELEIEASALGTRVFSILSGEFLFPDGTWAVIGENALCEPRSFDDSWIEGDRPLPVYVGVRKWSGDRENVTVTERLENLGGITTRFAAAADPEEMRDLHAGGPAGQVKRLRHVLKILWDSERDQLGDWHLIPVARLERFGADVRLSGRFIPPCLSLEASEPLFRIVREIRDQVAARARQLEEHKKQRGIQNAGFGSRDMVYLLALRSLNRHVPLLFHLTEARQVHPWDVYGALRQLIGELSSFSERVSALGKLDDGVRLLPPYDHRALGERFFVARDLIARLLDEITAGPDYVIRLTHDGTFYSADLKPGIFETGSRYYLALRTTTEPAAFLPSLDAAAKLSARNHLPVLAARALPGIGLSHLPVPPQELPRRADTHYFAVDTAGDQWPLVEREHALALHWTGAPADLEVELMVVAKG